MKGKRTSFGFLTGLVFRGAKDAVEEQSAKRELEQKLGRKVTEEELYSLGAHLDAAGEGNSSEPLKVTARETETPFAGAKQPMKRSTFWLIILSFVVGGALFLLPVIIKIMPEQTLHRLNPFSEKPPEGSFPAQIGNFNLVNSYDWYSGKESYQHGEHYEADYSNGTGFYVKYKLWIFKTEEELQARFEDLKKSMTTTGTQIADDKDSRYAIIDVRSGSSTVVFKNGLQLKQLSGTSQEVVNNLEGLLKNEPPVAAVPFKMVTPTPSLSSSSSSSSIASLTITQLLDAYKIDSAAADTKYKGKTITISGTVEVSEKDKQGNWMIGFMRPGSTKPADGMVVCSFEKAQESIVSKVKKGDSVTLQGKVTMGLVGSVILENCTKK